MLGVVFLMTPLMLVAQKNNTATTKPVATATKPAPATKPASKDTAVLKMFDAGASLQWTRHFRGRLDDVSEVLVSLGFDGKNCPR